MARARNIKPGLFKNEILGVEDPVLSLLFIGIWTLADKAGILEDRPVRIKGELFPYREKLDVDRYLTQLERLGFIHRYSCNNLHLIQIINFTKHQNPHHTEKDSEYPCFSDTFQVTVKPPLNNGYTPADSLIPDSLIPDSTTASKKPEASADFEHAWTKYPKRAGSNPKNRALKAWNARIKDGATAADIMAGIERYAAFIRLTGKAGTEYVMQASTFFGPDKHFMEAWERPQDAKKTDWWSSDKATQEKASEIGLIPRSGESWNDFKCRIKEKLLEH